ncbi:MAG TPA: twin-arginine translocation signal domain-containing protein, partial [Thermoanaerobaculia bacterium]|nr:twin-arginine translocation signal domain-containing protein [Thermoanaerobaculia bacterium]
MVGRNHGVSRRKFIQTAGAAAGSLIFPVYGRALQGAGGGGDSQYCDCGDGTFKKSCCAKTLKICQWSHFVPGYDKWFDGVFCK